MTEQSNFRHVCLHNYGPTCLREGNDSKFYVSNYERINQSCRGEPLILRLRTNKKTSAFSVLYSMPLCGPYVHLYAYKA